MLNSTYKLLLEKGWEVIRANPGQFQYPSDINFDTQNIVPATVPCTVASTFNLKEPDCWSPSINYDDYDWWYSCEFKSDNSYSKTRLVFEGLATLAQVWLNDKLVLDSQNMFHHHSIDVEKILSDANKNKLAQNKLTICFRSLSQQLSNKHLRPTWKTKLVANQSLRWYRTTLLGRIPGWTPPVSPVGPWKPIYFAHKNTPNNIELLTSVEDHDGIINLSFEIEENDKLSEAYLEVGQEKHPIKLTRSYDASRFSTDVRLKNVRLWWPHTHGIPHLYQASIVLVFDEEKQTTTLPSIGFKTIDLNRSEDNFEISINNESIFCRGACWTVSDIISLRASIGSLTRTLTLMRDAGANMIRIGGTMLYEQDEFYQICSELGIMVWQDFMFANMDYPFKDDSFLSSVHIEVNQQIKRLRQHSCLTIFCGNSEIQQQIAMLGFDKSVWEIEFYEKTLATICQELAPGHPYVSSSPCGGELPFRTNQDLSHYYGVGAYLRPVSELRSHDVKFTTECLGFSNIPISKTRNSVLNGQLPVTHNPIWKQRTPRDTATGWDFEDVRDHYLKELFSIEPIHLRSFDPERYMQLSEIATGEIMSRVYSEWRSNNSSCNGGLVWFMKDLWTGAGWGIIDSCAIPKACYYFLKRSWQPISLCATDESINGLQLHLSNESDKNLTGTVSIQLINHHHIEIANASKPINLEAKSNVSISAEHLLKSFHDITYNYRFGPQEHYAVLIQLRDLSTTLVSEYFYFPQSSMPATVSKDCVRTELTQIDKRHFELCISASDFLYGVNIEIKNANFYDNHFHMFPDSIRTISIELEKTPSKPISGYIRVLNIDDAIRIKVNKRDQKESYN